MVVAVTLTVVLPKSALTVGTAEVSVRPSASRTSNTFGRNSGLVSLVTLLTVTSTVCPAVSETENSCCAKGARITCWPVEPTVASWCSLAPVVSVMSATASV